VALKSDGTVWTWGENGKGQLGDKTTTQRLTPVQVSGLSGVTAVAAGFAHTLALKLDGTVWAWGGNGKGQLGDDTTTDRPTPVHVSGLSLLPLCGFSMASCDAATGSCATPIVCSASDDCHDTGTCDTTTGVCSANPAKPDDTTCSLGTCQAGTCTPTPDGGPDSGAGGSGVSSSSSSSSTGDNPPEATIDLSCHFGIPSGALSTHATWLGAIALLALRRRRTGLPSTKPHSF
jgi:hypothetical protein